MMRNDDMNGVIIMFCLMLLSILIRIYNIMMSLTLCIHEKESIKCKCQIMTGYYEKTFA